MNNFEKQLNEYVSVLNEALETYIPDEPYPESVICDAMRYSLLTGGKRIRGVLVLAFYQLYKQDVSDALPFAGALEMVHAYSLIHDDLPCMDDDDMRRGKPSCHIAYGEANALLAGDALLTLAFETITAPACGNVFSAAQIVKSVNLLAANAGCRGMIGGQTIDLHQERNPFSEELLGRTYQKKTGALIACAGELGCVLAEAENRELNAALSYCKDIGLAFQIVDDILDVTGDASVIGKPVGSDMQNGKQTYVQIYGISAAKQKVDELNASAKRALQDIQGDTTFLAGLADMLAGREK